MVKQILERNKTIPLGSDSPIYTYLNFYHELIKSPFDIAWFYSRKSNVFTENDFWESYEYTRVRYMNVRF